MHVSKNNVNIFNTYFVTEDVNMKLRAICQRVEISASIWR